jgi:hypothetical protein
VGRAELSVVRESSTEVITTECDRIAAECEKLLDSVASVDISIDRLHLSADDMQAQMVLLDEAQTTVKKQTKALATRVFWAAYSPAALMDRLGGTVSTIWLRSTGRGAKRTYRPMKPITDAGE